MCEWNLSPIDRKSVRMKEGKTQLGEDVCVQFKDVGAIEIFSLQSCK